jgi:hexosaminidase
MQSLYLVFSMKTFVTLFFFLASSLGGVLAQNLDLIPQPVKVKEFTSNEIYTLPEEAVLLLDKKLAFHTDFITSQFQKYTSKLPKVEMESFNEQSTLILDIEENMSIPKEGYTLKINKKGVRIKGKTIEGVLNGYQTLLQIFSSKSTQKGTLPFVKIKDYPAMEWRGMMLDVSRQFFDKERVMQYIDWLAAHKMNIFHWHLTDDNGWRIEIKGLPDLTLKGAWRGPGEVLLPSYGSGNKRYGGFYTQQDIKEVVAFAKARGVSIVPEIEIPGHSKAVIASYPEIGCVTSEQSKSVQGEVNNVWCVGREENYTLLETILDEVVDLFPFEYIHVAGDEVNTTTWKHCSKCTTLMQQQGFTDAFQLQNYFFKRVETMIEKKNKKVIGWNEIIKGGQLSSNTAISAWQGVKYGIEAVKLGYKTVMIPGQYTYFDMAQSDSERGHRWAGLIDAQKVYSFNPIPSKGLNSKEKKLIIGVQGALWSEYLDRPERFMEYQSFPRISALAEIGWSQNKHKNWEYFYKRLTHSHFNRLENMGIAFRDFPPKAFYENDQITVELPYSNATVRYTNDGTDPTFISQIYEKPILTKSFEEYKFKTFFGKESQSPAISAKLPAIASWKSFMAEKKMISKNVTSVIDQNGIWKVYFTSKNENVNNGSCRRISLYENNVMIFNQTSNNDLNKQPSYKIEIPNYKSSYEYRLELEFENTEGSNAQAEVFLEHSKYIEPLVQASSSLSEKSNFKLENLEDYNPESYFRSNRPCEKGDWILYSFTKPIATSQIEIITGIPHHPRFIINEGHIEYTYDGVSFEKGPDFEYGVASIFPKQPVLGVKIVIKSTNNEPTVAIQDLKIKPKNE